MYINKLTVYSASGEYKKKIFEQNCGTCRKYICICTTSLALRNFLLALFPACPSKLPANLLLLHFSSTSFIFPLRLPSLCVHRRWVFFSPFLQQEEHSAHGERKNTQRSLKRQDGAIEVLGVLLKSSAGKSTAGLGEVGCFHSDKG